MKRNIELLAPAGDLERLKYAVVYGADAVYIGGKEFSLRANASLFTREEIREGVSFAHEKGVRVYVTVNVYPDEEDFQGLDDYLLFLDDAQVDAIIVSSLAILLRAKQLQVHYELHVSTQCSISNTESALFWKKLGANRVVLARECPLKEISQIRRASGMEIEIFLHGGMCSSFSGRCSLSDYMANRNANRGGCAHSCRWDYTLSSRDDVSLSDAPVIFASYDLCGLPLLPEILKTGVCSLKIEGRMKSVHYLATLLLVYRSALRDCAQSKELFAKNLPFYLEELKKAENRPAATGFFKSRDDGALLEHINDEMAIQNYIGQVTSTKEKETTILVRNHFEMPLRVEILSPTGKRVETIEKMYNEYGEEFLVANPGQVLHFTSSLPISEYALLRKESMDEKN